MIARILVDIATAVLLVASTVAQSPPNSPVPPDSEIRKILVERIDTFHQGVGIVVGVIEPQGRRMLLTAASIRAIRGRSTATRFSKSVR